MPQTVAVVYCTAREEDVYLFCDSCDWQKNFGPFTNVGELIRAEQRHRRKEHGEDYRS